MFLIAFLIGVFSALFIKVRTLDIIEWMIDNPSKRWHLLHIAINIITGLSLIFLCWSWIAGSIGLGFISIGLASIYVWTYESNN